MFWLCSFQNQATSEQKGVVRTLSGTSQEMYRVVFLTEWTYWEHSQGTTASRNLTLSFCFNCRRQDLFCQWAQPKITTTLPCSSICQSQEQLFTFYTFVLNNAAVSHEGKWINMFVKWHETSSKALWTRNLSRSCCWEKTWGLNSCSCMTHKSHF